MPKKKGNNLQFVKSVRLLQILKRYLLAAIENLFALYEIILF